MTQKTDPKTTVYFDGSCPLCDAEISVYRKRANSIEFVDVSDAALVCPRDLSQEKAMKRFHVRRSDGTLLDGGDAFIELWHQTPGFRLFGKLFALPGFRWVANKAYDGFLIIRPTMQKLFTRFRRT